MKYYSTDKIDKKDGTYNIIFGERSNGKTYALLKKALFAFAEHGDQFGYVRRWKEDISGRRAQRLFAGLNENGEVSKATNGEYTHVYYFAGRFYLCYYDDKGKPIYNDDTCLGYTFALSDSEHDKSTSFPRVTLIVFDEFLTQKLYLNDEFVIFMNVVSTIVRKRENVKIYMLGNTVNKYCPYFQEMGLDHILKMEQGTIDVYRYGDSPMKVAVEYCKPGNKTRKTSSQYFAFGNPKLEMITGGVWEMNIYPHKPCKFVPRDVLLKFFIEFNDDIYQCLVVEKEGDFFLFIHPKKTPIANPDDLLYTLEHSARPAYNRNIYKPMNRVQERIKWFFVHDKVFYQDNETGEAINNYLKICRGRA